MRIRRLSDIKTHGTLDRKGLLVGVAKNMHKLGSHNGTEDAENSSNWNVERHIYKKDESSKKVSAKVIPPSKGLLSSLSEGEIKQHLIERFQDLLDEFYKANAEGLPVSMAEIERIQATLARFQTE